MHMHGVHSVDIAVLCTGMAAMLPDGQTASGLGCLSLTPDDLIDYNYCQSSWELPISNVLPK